MEKYLPGGVQVTAISPSNEDIREYLEMKLKNDSDSEAMSPTLKAGILKRIPEMISDAYVIAGSISKARVFADNSA